MTLCVMAQIKILQYNISNVTYLESIINESSNNLKNNSISLYEYPIVSIEMSLNNNNKTTYIACNNNNNSNVQLLSVNDNDNDNNNNNNSSNNNNNNNILHLLFQMIPYNYNLSYIQNRYAFRFVLCLFNM